MNRKSGTNLHCSKQCHTFTWALRDSEYVRIFQPGLLDTLRRIRYEYIIPRRNIHGRGHRIVFTALRTFDSALSVYRETSIQKIPEAEVTTYNSRGYSASQFTSNAIPVSMNVRNTWGNLIFWQRKII